MTPFRNSLWFWSTLTLLWSGALLYLSLTPTPPTIDGPLGWDKLQHAVALGALALLASRSCAVFRKTRPANAAIAGFFVAIIFGGLIELLQDSCTANRQADALDFAADTIGALIAVTCFHLRYQKRGIP